MGKQGFKKAEFTEEFDPDWIKSGINSHCIDYTREFGNFLKQNHFTSSQFRNFYGELKRIQMKGLKNNKNAFLLLEPKLAYAAARETDNKKKDSSNEFYRIISRAHRLVLNASGDESEKFNNFCDFVEAILAFHKAYEQKVMNN